MEEIKDKEIKDFGSKLSTKIEEINEIDGLMSPKTKTLANETRENKKALKEFGYAGISHIGKEEVNRKEEEFQKITNVVDDLGEKVDLLLKINSITNREKLMILKDVDAILSVSGAGFVNQTKVNNANEEATYALKSILSGRKNGIELSQDLSNQIKDLINPESKESLVLNNKQKL